MEDLWKLTRLDYRISAIAEQRAYEEIVRRYHLEEEGLDHESLAKNVEHRKPRNQE